MKPLYEEDKMKPLETRARQKPFWYTRALDGNILIKFGKGYRIAIPAQVYEGMIKAFGGKEVQVRSTQANPEADSVEAWVCLNFTETRIVAYLGPILVDEGRAEWVDDARPLTLRFCGD